MRNLKLILEYDGSAFFGFQKQPRHHTVQETLEKAISKILNTETKIQSASGRTDTGVHASYQVVNFKTDNPIAIKDLWRGLNAVLPKPVAVKKIEQARPEFHARYSACSKTYEYRIWNHPVRSPLEGAWCWHVPQKLDLSAMRRAMTSLKGRRDFKAFCAARSSAKSTVRNIKKFTLRKSGSVLIFRIEADGFLYHMVRNMIGTLVEVGKGRLETREVARILRSRDRRAAGPTAPGQGLRLVHVRY